MGGIATSAEHENVGGHHLLVVRRLYGNSHLLNDAGQYAYYGRVGGCLITGNEDGVKHCAMNILYSLQHLGYVIPQQADAGCRFDFPNPDYR